ncbi:MAG TPA: DUF3085 domain-containing protein [Acetobacteraceae bacterium]|nr:DUF3085 domain-containing protein [Acetobacteraceae bacterium]
MKLHFDAQLVKRLLDHSKAAPDHAPTLSQRFSGKFRKDGRDVGANDAWPTAADIDPAKLHAGLWLVGDQGIYLMSNGTPGLLAEPGTTKHVVVHAAEADPALPFDTWWDVKRRAFGVDDGVIYLDLAFVECLLAGQRDGRICLDLTPTSVKIAVPPAAPVTAPSCGPHRTSGRSRREMKKSQSTTED